MGILELDLRSGIIRYLLYNSTDPLYLVSDALFYLSAIALTAFSREMFSFSSKKLPVSSLQMRTLDQSGHLAVMLRIPHSALAKSSVIARQSSQTTRVHLFEMKAFIAR